MHKLDWTKRIERSDPPIWLGCNLELRQIARQLLAKKFEGGGEGARDDLFPELQWCYPATSTALDGEPEYVLCEVMSDDDIAYNVARLRKAAPDLSNGSSRLSPPLWAASPRCCPSLRRPWHPAAAARHDEPSAQSS
jgi:hypothetical protein